VAPAHGEAAEAPAAPFADEKADRRAQRARQMRLSGEN